MAWDDKRCEYCDSILSKDHHCKYMDMSDIERTVKIWREENGLDDAFNESFAEVVAKLEKL